MEISLADERVLVLKEQLTIDQAEGRAWSKKIDAFGRMVKVASFLQRPKDDEFELIYKEHRYEPFWHVICRAHYVYERQRQFALELSGKEVEAVTIDNTKHKVENGRLTLSGVEHCQEQPVKEMFVDGYTGEPAPGMNGYLQYPANDVPLSYLEELSEQGAIVVPPQVRSSAIVRDGLLGVLKQIKADRVLTDEVTVERLDLYYRPVFAFQYRWHTKEKEAILEYDGLSGQWQTDGRTYQQYLGRLADPDFLFDVGADTLDVLVPGGGIAVKLARKGLDVARNRGNSS
jgi:hypothetical protein